MKIHRAIAIMLASNGGMIAAEPEKLWSLKPLGNVQPPAPAASWERNPIDTLIGGKAPTQADRRSLIRRASYDLTGLPPATELVEKFAADPRPDANAFADAVESMLASEHYGEHWGRRWLDVVRYADTAGENSDHPLPHAWRYRNWVIEAVNNDLPYDQFVKQQLAGDLLPDASADSIVATGYLAIARRFGHDIDKSMHLTYEDAIDNLGKAFLGLTISCARCHDHKHDPITARDYYALYGVLDSTRFAYPGCEPNQQPRDLVPIATPDLLAKQQAWQISNNELERQLLPFAQEETERSKELKDLAATCSKVISSGDVPDGGAVRVNEKPLRFSAQKGDVIQLSILPRASHGADTTLVEFSITHENQTWSVADLIDQLDKGNPNGNWCFLDTSGDPKFLPEQNDFSEGRSELKGWHNGDTPSVFVNTSNKPVQVWTTLPARTFFVHPGPTGPVAIAWLSPVDGEISINLKVGDGHPGGDGVSWKLDHFSSPKMATAYQNLGEVGTRRRIIDGQLRDHSQQKPTVPVAYAVTEGEVKSTRMQLRGDPEDLGEEVPRAFLTVLGGGTLGSDKSSGRLELAEKIASRDNPLTSRVMANRIWAGHFGRGIVATPNDFGSHGAAPTNPPLLDFLARSFVKNGWSTKALHRLIMASASYQQTASNDRLLRRKLTAEELRDTLLVASGELDRTPGHAHPFPPESGWSFTQHAPFAAEYPSKKRSIYLMQKRNLRSQFFALFDGADPNASTATRNITTSPIQALYFMNDPFFHRCAEAFSERVMARSNHTPSRLDFAYQELFARPANEAELTAFTDFARASGTSEEGLWNAYARILLSSNELFHLD